MLIIGDTQQADVVARNRELAKGELDKLYYSHEGRSAIKWHHYLKVYEEHLTPYKSSSAPLRVLEIGVQHGGSLQLWRKFFGPAAIIYGIDIDPRCKEFEGRECQIRIGDQSSAEFLQGVVAEMGGLDVVIDDGSHIANHQLASFKALWPLLSSSGIYICEDLHTSYWDGWEGGQGRAGTFIEMIKAMIDELHRWYTDIRTPLSEMNLHTAITGIHIYDSIAIIGKGMRERPYVVRVGRNSL